MTNMSINFLRKIGTYIHKQTSPAQQFINASKYFNLLFKNFCKPTAHQRDEGLHAEIRHTPSAHT